MVRSFGSEIVRRVFATALVVLTLVVGNVCPVGAQAPARAAHTLSFGVLGAANLATFRVVGTPTYEQRVGGAAGAWMNVPLGRFFSVEPQLQLSSVPSRQTSGLRNSAFLSDVSVRYISVPMLAKLHLKWIALSVGGQVDVPISVVDSPNVWTIDAVAPLSASAIGGLELFPRSRVSLYGRYMYGFTNVDGREVPDSANAFYNQGVQAGVRIRLFGGRRSAPRAVPAKAAKGEPAPTAKPDSTVDECLVRTGTDRPAQCPVLDTDGDGVLGNKDTCPKQAGIAKYNGCTPPDTDRDGLVDDEDRCPTVLGARETMGCPRITSFPRMP